MTQSDNGAPTRASAWLSRGVEHLFATLDETEPTIDFDVLIVGSGYGGAVAAAALAGSLERGRPVSVCVLERGKEYLPGAFPSRMSDLAGHVRYTTPNGAQPGGDREGLFDVRVGNDVSALVANGLGGGSLINAGVMVRPRRKALAALAAKVGDLEPYFVRAMAALGARAGGADNTMLRHAGPRPLKFTALEKLAGTLQPASGAFQPAALSIAMRDGPNAAGVALNACALCGDCATGCNLNAKDSLDTNLLVQAQRQGAQLYTGATVLRIERDEQRKAWCVLVNYTDAQLRARQDLPYKVRARKVILAAGTFGSTEILLRSQSDTLKFSSLIGQQFSSNGDMIAVAYDQQEPVNAVADENQAPRERGVGPTITGMIDLQAPYHDLLVEDLAVPAPLRRLFEESASTANILHELSRRDRSAHTGQPDERDPCALDRAALGRSALLAVMGDDRALGSLELIGNADDTCGDGAIRVRWPTLRTETVFQAQLNALAGAPGPDPNQPGPNGTILPNPLWKLLPESMQFLLSDKRGPLLTVHPLGGCAIGESAATGVVNDCGEVFRAPADTDELLFDGLVVLDGAILPGALGVNPALTIAALAMRALDKLHAKWQWTRPDAQAAPVPERRPRFAPEPPAAPAAPAPTEVQFVERMAGKAILQDDRGADIACMLELTLHFSPLSLASLVLPQDGAPVPIRRTLGVDAGRSTLQVYDAAAWDEWTRNREANGVTAPPPLLSAKVCGRLDFLHREASTPWRRLWRALVPWLFNRGLRDLWQWGAQRHAEGGFKAEGAGATFWGDLKRRRDNALALASHAGEVRLFDYTLQLFDASSADARLSARHFERRACIGQKRFTYERACNPWNQLTRMSLDSFPGLARNGDAAPVLELVTGFLVRENVPLFRILGQQDQPAALADVVSLGGYLLRLLLTIHVWSLRKPDDTPLRAPQRLPGDIDGLPRPQITELEVDQLPDGTPVHVRLTRYCRADSAPETPPVVMIHGYSASGTTFAHPMVRPNLASYLWDRKRDIWILDLRTSSGMPSARHPWSFEDAALADIPAAIAHICDVTGKRQVDIVAHCMGAAMFGMAALGEPGAGDPYFAEREKLRERVRRVILSQVGPVVVFSQANIFRAYLMSFLRQLLPFQRYTFRIEGEPSLMDELLDRALATMPYPRAEYHVENPAWPWSKADFVRTRHRMDALYGRDFSLCNVDRPVLDHIDDFFGPLNIDTVSQAMHFARLKTITNRAGRNAYVSRKRIKERWFFDTLSLHGEDNGLADVATLGRMQAAFEDTLFAFVPMALKGFGHQDCFIGRDGATVFAAIEAFLAVESLPPGAYPMTGAGVRNRWVIRAPWSGPVRTSLETPGQFQVGAGADPLFQSTAQVAFVPVSLNDGHYAIWTEMPGEAPRATLLRTLQLYAGAADDNGWMQFAPSPATAGPAGLLMLLLYDAQPSFFVPQGPEQDFRHPSLRDKELMALLRAQRTPGLAPAAGLAPGAGALLQELVRFVDEAFDDVAWRIEQELAERQAAAFESGLVAFSKPVDGAPGRLCFALASCQYPAGLLDQEPAFASFARLAARLDANSNAAKPELLILVGDQIYSDATAGLFDPSALDDRYVRPYEKLFCNEHVKAVMRRLPTYMMLDDHEIADNWEPLADAKRIDPRMKAGRAAYLRFQRTSALVPTLGAAQAPDRLASSLPLRGFPFFIADTRTERAARSAATVGSASIMEEGQLDMLLDWLLAQHKAAPERPKFIASPSILAPRRMRAIDAELTAARLGTPPAQFMPRRLRSDAWDGHPQSMHRLLAHIARHRIGNVVFLSGDEHISCAATLSIGPAGANAPVTVLSIHSSALYAPFPFANSSAQDLADSGDAFTFCDPDPANPGQQFECKVEVAFHPGDGYALVRAEERDGQWTVQWEFDRARPRP
jgi:cholesterol oxidase